jgi:hypothetical protein
MQPRPSNKEICNKVAAALEALRAGRWQPGLAKHLSDDMAELGLESGTDLGSFLVTLLEEIQRAGPINCYRGTRPPQKSYEPEIENLELWAYSWHSDSLGKRMYLKFVLKKQCYINVRFHEDKPQE